MKYNLNQSGVALLITMLLLGTILATALGVAMLVMGETGINRLVDDSVFAVFAADAGLEKMFYACSGKVAYPASAVFSNSNIGNGASYNVHMDPNNSCGDNKVVSTGAYGTAKRSFEAAY